MDANTTALVAANAMNKGDVLATARVAGIQAAKHAATDRIVLGQAGYLQQRACIGHGELTLSPARQHAAR